MTPIYVQMPNCTAHGPKGFIHHMIELLLRKFLGAEVPANFLSVNDSGVRKPFSTTLSRYSAQKAGIYFKWYDFTTYFSSRHVHTFLNSSSSLNVFPATISCKNGQDGWTDPDKWILEKWGPCGRRLEFPWLEPPLCMFHWNKAFYDEFVPWTLIDSTSTP